MYKILLAISQDDESRELGGLLSANGFAVAHAKSVSSALASLVEKGASAVIMDSTFVASPEADLHERIRGNQLTANIPVVILSDAFFEYRGFRPDSDVFLVRPLKSDELVSRLKSIVASKSSQGLIEGTLAHMPLPDIIQFLHMNRKEGELRLFNDVLTGSVFMKDGDVVNAALGHVEREKALYRLLGWTDARFEFRPGSVGAARKINSSVGNLLMEGMRQIDEYKKHEKSFPPLDAQLLANVEVSAVPKGLQPAVYEVLRLSKLYQKVEDVLDRCQSTDYEAMSTLSQLIAKKAITLVEQGQGLHKVLSAELSVRLGERIARLSNEAHSRPSGRVAVMASSAELAERFTQACLKVAGFSPPRTQSLSASLGLFLGDTAAIRLHGGAELSVFTIPHAHCMGPLIKAFSSNVLAAILLWDDRAQAGLRPLSATGEALRLVRDMPIAYVYAGPREGMQEAINGIVAAKAGAVFGAEALDEAGCAAVFGRILSDLTNERAN